MHRHTPAAAEDLPLTSFLAAASEAAARNEAASASELAAASRFGD